MGSEGSAAVVFSSAYPIVFGSVRRVKERQPRKTRVHSTLARQPLFSSLVLEDAHTYNAPRLVGAKRTNFLLPLFSELPESRSRERLTAQ